MVVPVNADVNEAQYITEETGRSGRKAARPVPCGDFISSTIMVMMTANTPSLKASMRPLVILQYGTTNGNSSTTTPGFDVSPR